MQHVNNATQIQFLTDLSLTNINEDKCDTVELEQQSVLMRFSALQSLSYTQLCQKGPPEAFSSVSVFRPVLNVFNIVVERVCSQ